MTFGNSWGWTSPRLLAALALAAAMAGLFVVGRRRMAVLGAAVALLALLALLLGREREDAAQARVGSPARHAVHGHRASIGIVRRGLQRC